MAWSETSSSDVRRGEPVILCHFSWSINSHRESATASPPPQLRRKQQITERCEGNVTERSGSNHRQTVRESRFSGCNKAFEFIWLRRHRNIHTPAWLAPCLQPNPKPSCRTSRTCFDNAQSKGGNQTWLGAWSLICQRRQLPWWCHKK